MIQISLCGMRNGWNFLQTFEVSDVVLFSVSQTLLSQGWKVNRHRGKLTGIPTHRAAKARSDFEEFSWGPDSDQRVRSFQGQTDLSLLWEQHCHWFPLLHHHESQKLASILCQPKGFVILMTSACKVTFPLFAIWMHFCFPVNSWQCYRSSSCIPWSWLGVLNNISTGSQYKIQMSGSVKFPFRWTL